MKRISCLARGAVMSAALVATAVSLANPKFADVTYSTAPHFQPQADQRALLLTIAGIFKRPCDTTDYAGWNSKNPANDLTTFSAALNASLSGRYLVRTPDLLPPEVQKSRAAVFFAEAKAGKSQLMLVWSSSDKVVVLGICGNSEAMTPAQSSEPAKEEPPQEVAGDNDRDLQPLKPGKPGNSSILGGPPLDPGNRIRGD